MSTTAYARLPTDADADADAIPLDDRASPDPRDRTPREVRPETTSNRRYLRLFGIVLGVLAVALASFRLGQLSVDRGPYAEAPGGSTGGIGSGAPPKNHSTMTGNKLSVG